MLLDCESLNLIIIIIIINISAFVPEVSIDPMKIIEEAVLEFTDKKELLMAYMSSMIVGENYLKLEIKHFSHHQKRRLHASSQFLKDQTCYCTACSLCVSGESAAPPAANVVTDKGFYLSR